MSSTSGRVDPSKLHYDTQVVAALEAFRDDVALRQELHARRLELAEEDVERRTAAWREVYDEKPVLYSEDDQRAIDEAADDLLHQVEASKEHLESLRTDYCSCGERMPSNPCEVCGEAQESDAVETERLTRQSTAPLERHSLTSANRQAREVARMMREQGDLSPAY